MSGIQIFIKPSLGPHIATLDVESSDSIANVEQKIDDKLGIQPSVQILYFQSQLLSPTDTLADYNIQKENILYLYVAPIIQTVTSTSHEIDVVWYSDLGSLGSYPAFEATASPGNLTCQSTQSGCTISNVASGTTYSVTVTPGSLNGPGGSFLALPEGTSAAVSTTTMSTPPTTTTPPPSPPSPASSLASTGSDVTLLMGAGPGLMLLGAAALYGVKRLRRSTTE